MSEALALSERLTRREGEELFRLREKLDLLKEENRQLKEALVKPAIFPREWNLRPAQAKLLACFLASPSNVRTKDQLRAAISANDISHDDTLKVTICGLRKKLQPTGVEILTRWGVGYEITPRARVLLEEACQ